MLFPSVAGMEMDMSKNLGEFFCELSVSKSLKYIDKIRIWIQRKGYVPYDKRTYI